MSKALMIVGVTLLAVAVGVGIFALGGYVQRANEAIQFQEATVSPSPSTGEEPPGSVNTGNTGTAPQTVYVAPPAAAAPPSNLVQMVIPEGTVIPVTLDNSLNSGTNSLGDSVNTTVRSTQNGDAEFPLGTKIIGSISELQRKADGQPGMLGLIFRSAHLPDGRIANLEGSLISLDDTTKLSDGRLVAKGPKSTDKIKFIAIGAGIGVVLGKITKKNEWVSGGIGALAGYIYAKIREKKMASEDVKVSSGTAFGVRIDRELTYYAPKSFADAHGI
jgi:hypothetical protein